VRSLYTRIPSKDNISSNPLLLMGSKKIPKIKENCIFLSDDKIKRIFKTNSDLGITSFSVTFLVKMCPT
jgi:hypothetical protein